MYVPAHLGAVHKTLMQYGYKMREKYGPEFKRNIRFDDIELSLCIDIRIPGANSWVTVSHERALADRRAWARSVEAGNDALLSSAPLSAPSGGLLDAQGLLPAQVQLPQPGGLAHQEGSTVSPTSSASAPTAENPYSVLRPSNLVVLPRTSSPTSAPTTSHNGGHAQEEAVWGTRK